MHRHLLDALAGAARTDRGIILVESSDRESFLSYADLQSEALRVLAGLQARGIGRGDELVFQYAGLRGLIVTYWACLAGAIVPIPLEFGDQDGAIAKAFAVWKVLANPWLATDSDKLADKFGAWAARAGDADVQAQWRHMQDRLARPLDEAGTAAAAPADLTPDDIAFIQFSSGSTGMPKGVVLTHRNLLTNIGDILASVGHADGDRFLTWKPITHDFGMIAFHLAPVVAASDQVRIETDAFIWNPALWFAKVHEHRAAILGSPNFGYRHFLKLFRRGRDKSPAWDLSCVKVILNGAEPISRDLCEEFSAELAAFGLPAHALTPGYGLAEGSLIASLCPVAERGIRAIDVDRRKLGAGDRLRFVAAGSEHAASFVDCGLPYPNTAIRIADARRRPLADGHVGHIHIRGGSVTSGYYRNPEASAALIDAEGWLDTQDLGAIVDGRLYVVGRVKEMVIVGGVNYFPHDIEQAILRAKGENELNKYIVAGVGGGNGASDSGSEALLVFVYHKKADGEFAAVAAEVRRIVRDGFGLAVAHVIPAARIPKTTSGKVQRFRLVQDFLDGRFDEALARIGETRAPAVRPPEPADAAPAAAPVPGTADATPVRRDDAILDRVGAIVARCAGRPAVDPDTGFFDLGLTSMRLVDMKMTLEDAFGVALDATSTLDFPTVRALAARIGALAAAQAATVAPQREGPAASAIGTTGAHGGALPAGGAASSGMPADATASSGTRTEAAEDHLADRAIAIVGMACRFPGGAGTPAAFWRVLEDGIDPVREVPAERWAADPQAAAELTTRQGGFLDGVDRFDPLFFGISPAEATAMDPQQRLLLEVCHEAFENAGWNPASLAGTRTGVFVGISGSDYGGVGRDLGHGTGPYTFTGTMFNTAAGRLSYTFGLQGPSVAIDTACSSSLVAVHQGMRELRAGSCDAVVAGGVNLILKADGHVSFSRLNALAASGRCRSFDDGADGYIRGEGCGIVILKRLADAERDGDRILAVVRGAAVNHNGRSGGLTVPSGTAQEALVRAALADAGMAPDDIDYVEAHGSGTRLGDPQELGALARVFAGRREPLRIGSVKSNVGHLESAAGVAGLIKLVLMLCNKRFAPNLHFRSGNGLIDWKSTPLEVVAASAGWPARGEARAAGISSFGISGTNAHVVLQEYVPAAAAADGDTSAEEGSFVFTLSAKSAEGLRATARAFADHLAARASDANGTPPLASLCRTVNLTRSRHPHRHAIVLQDGANLPARLARFADAADGREGDAPSAAAGRRGKLAFLFTGQGSVYPGIARSLDARFAVFRKAFDRCDALFVRHAGLSVRALARDGSADDIARPAASQALIFSVGHALCRLWESLGVRPAMVLGHSIGEYVAAVEAGIVTLEDAVAMVALRGRIMDETPADGAMAGVLAGEEAVRSLLAAHPAVHIAAVNTDENHTISGPRDAVAAVLAAARKARVFTETLPMRHAFHSPHMRAGAGRLEEGMRGIAFRDPALPMFSTRTGREIVRGDEADGRHWAGHLCQPVLFRDALRAALAAGADTFVEIGGTAALSGLGAQIADGDGIAFLPSLREGRDAAEQFNLSLAALWCAGHDIDWGAYHEGRRGLVHDLPNTAYHRGRYWFAPVAADAAGSTASARAACATGAAAPARRDIATPPGPAQPAATWAASASLPGADGPVPQAATSAGPTVDEIRRDIQDMIAQVTGLDAADVGADVQIFALGIDSLMLAQLDKRLVRRYGVEIPVKLFFAELDTPARIAAYIAAGMPEEFRRQVAPSDAAAAVTGSVDHPAAGASPAQAAGAVLPFASAGLPGGTADGAIAALFQSQLDIMREQLALLRAAPGALQGGATANMPGISAGGGAHRIVGDAGAHGMTPAATASAQDMARAAAASSVNRHAQPAAGRNALRDIVLHEEDVTDAQRAFIRDLAARIVARTPKSRAYAQRYRGVLADWIATLNFSLTTKEMAYPVVAARSQGARFWDIDGNEYIDTATGYGATFFGHNPDFIADALRAQLEEGFELGPQSDLAGEVAALIAELTGAERVAFCNSGTEAVMVAVRLARAVTRRRKFVRFTNAYHGSFDGVLAEAGEDGAVPVAPGIVASMVEDTVVLPYGTPGSLAAIRALGDDLAAVLVEPVQSRAPENHSRDYLQALRDITTELGAALIFDEMITGFRVHPGGVQAWYGIRADLATYGKVVGGGMPIGVVAGNARYMDAIDGGSWNFGDASGPSRETTFFAGTFCKHPLAMAAARAVLLKIRAEGKALMDAANAMTERFAARANAWFEAEEVPIRVLRFGSMYRFETRLSRDPARSALEMNLLFKHLLLDGVFFWERRTSFFSTAHTDDDADRILAAVQRAVGALRAGGFDFRCASRAGTQAVAQAGAQAALPAAGTLPDGFPLSSEERRMVVLSLMKGGDAAYHVTGALRVAGPLDADRFARAVAALAARHPILGCRYAFEDGGIVHRNDAGMAPHIEHIALGGNEADAAIAAFVRPFDPKRAPLWRIGVLRRHDREHVVVLDFHHLVADGISMSILIEDLFRLYHGEPLDPVPATYADFVAWEQGFAAGDECRRQRDWWRERLTPLPPALALPTDRPRPARNDFAGASVVFTIGAGVRDGVAALARRRRVTPFMVLLSAYAVFLQRLTRQDDLCIGTPFDRRRNGNFERTVGMFAQTLVLRLRASGGMSFGELLDQAREVCAGAYSHADCSLEDLLSALAVPRDLSRNPLFDTMFIYENGNRRVVDGTELSATTLPVAMQGSPFDLTLEMTESQGEYRCAFIYATRLFDATTVQRWAAGFAGLLDRLLAAPECRLADCDIVDAAQRRLLLEGFNATARDYPLARTVCALFADTAARLPDAAAVVCGDGTVSYAALSAQAGRIAGCLAAAGVRRGHLVGILLPRGPAMIAAMLGILGAGAAYVPIDPAYPAARIAAMVEASGIGVLLSRADLAAAAGFAGSVLDPDALPPVAGDAVPPEAAGAEDVAYVIFTSGSTGRPKGVMVEHRGVTNFLFAMEEALSLPERAPTLGLTTISFDIFVLEVFLTLVRGGTLVLADESEQRDPQALLRLVRRHGVTVMQATPSRVQTLLAGRGAAEAFGGLSTLLVGGEALPEALLRTLQEVPGLRIFNMYGPTETTVWSAVRDVTAAAAVTLGGPIANTRCYVLDEDGRPCPVGCPGELWIGGAGLARGYLGDPERTAASFVDDPFLPGQRMYRTGDRASWTAAGELACHGRTDGQVKLRGYRIELGEIEEVLLRHPGIAQAAVAVRELTPGNPVLAAWCVAADAAQDIDVDALRAHAARLLPDYMVPAVVSLLPALPLTPNGKTDRRSLPDIAVPAAGATAGTSAEADAAVDALDAEILAIWKEILGDRPIGLHDSFFDVGGNSFSLVAMHGRLSERYPGAVDVAEIFANPTVAALREQIERSWAHGDAVQELPFPPAFFRDAAGGVPGMQATAQLAVRLDGAPWQAVRAAAARFAVEPLDLCFAFYLFYLNKLLGVNAFEAAAAFGPRAEYVLAEADFGAVRGLPDLVALVKEQHAAQRWTARRLDRQAATAGTSSGSGHGLRLLFAAAGAVDAREAAAGRFGFDAVLLADAGASSLRLALAYDGRRLDAQAMQQFAANYLKVARALAATQAAAGQSTDPALAAPSPTSSMESQS